MAQEHPTLNPKKQDVPDAKQDGNDFIDIEYVCDPDDLLDELVQRKDSYLAGQLVWGSIYYEAVAFFAGRQYYEYNISSGKLDYVKLPYRNYPRVTINRIVGKCRAVVSHMTSNLPTANVVPNSASDDDVYAARCGENWLKHSEFNNGTRNVYREAARMNVVFGHSWIKTMWDKYGGKAYGEPDMEPVMKECPACAEGAQPEQSEEQPEQAEPQESEAPEGSPEEEASESPEEESQEQQPEQPQGPCPQCNGTKQIQDVEESTGVPKTQQKMDENGKPALKNIQFEGEILKRAVSPLNMLYDPSVIDFENSPDCIETRYETIDYIKETIPNTEDITWDDGDEQPATSWEAMVNFAVDNQPGSGRHAVMVYEYWSKATQDFPQGLHAIWIKDKLRVAEPMDTLEGDRLPYSHSKYVSIPGLMRGMGLVEILKATQTAYNKTASQILENNQRMNNMNWIYNSTTKILNTITNESGQHIIYDGPGPAPVASAAPAMSNLAFNILKSLDEAFDSLSGVPKVAEGITDPSFNSGEQVEAATENAKQIHVPEIDDFVEAVADSCSLELRFVQKNMSKETLVKFMGPDGQFIVEKFEGAMIKDNWNVRFLPGSALSLSRSAQVRELEMLGQIVMNGQADPDQKKIIIDKLVDFITHGEKDRFVSETNRHEMKIRRVINDIKTGVCADPSTVFMPWHAPFGKIWMSEIENVLDTEEFDNNWDQDAKMNLVKLWEGVTMKVQQLQMQAAQQIANGPSGQPHPAGAGPSMPKQPPPGGTPGGAKIQALNQNQGAEGNG